VSCTLGELTAAGNTYFLEICFELVRRNSALSRQHVSVTLGAAALPALLPWILQAVVGGGSDKPQGDGEETVGNNTFVVFFFVSFLLSFFVHFFLAFFDSFFLWFLLCFFSSFFLSLFLFFFVSLLSYFFLSFLFLSIFLSFFLFLENREGVQKGGKINNMQLNGAYLFYLKLIIKNDGEALVVDVNEAPTER
jgi:hypothetical protein